MIFYQEICLSNCQHVAVKAVHRVNLIERECKQQAERNVTKIIHYCNAEPDNKKCFYSVFEI